MLVAYAVSQVVWPAFTRLDQPRVAIVRAVNP
jgi:hypothetical protein